MTTAIARRTHFRFEQAAQAIIAAKRSPHTKTAYRRDLRRWIEFCTEMDVDPLHTPIQATTLFRDHLLTSLSNESAHRCISAMSSIYRLLQRGNVVPANPFHPHVLSWPVQSAIPKTKLVTAKEAKAMFKHAAADKNTRQGIRDLAIMRLLYDTGLRRVSVAQLIRSKYDDKTGSIQAIVKGAKEVELELPATSCDAIKAWLEVAPSSPYLFPGVRGHLTPRTINNLVKKRALGAGAKHVHPHSFRAAFVTAGYDAGLPEHEVQASVHHSDPKTTRRYDRHARGRTVAQQVAAFRKNGDQDD